MVRLRQQNSSFLLLEASRIKRKIDGNSYLINRKLQGLTEMKNRIIGVIQWLYVETAQGGHIRSLHPGEAPRAVSELGDETPVAVYAYCNLHGLWTTKL